MPSAGHQPRFLSNSVGRDGIEGTPTTTRRRGVPCLYAETGSQYIEVLKKIIEQNNLKDFDEARLLPSSKDLESLI